MPGRFSVLIVLTPAFQPTAGGVQMSTRKMGEHFAQRGHQVTVFSFTDHDHAHCEFGQLVRAPVPGGRSSADNLDALRQCLTEVRPDVVINQMPYEHAIGEVLLESKQFLLLGCLRNTLFSVKGDIEGYVRRTVPSGLRGLARSGLIQRAFLALHRQRHRADLQRILRTYDHFVMFGPPNLEELAWFLPDFSRDKVRLIPNSIRSVAEFVPKKEKRLLWLGRIAHEQKRAELILPIWRMVSQVLPDWELDVVGDGPLLCELRQSAKDQSMVRIHFHGRQVPDDYYRRAAIFFMTSAFEGFPNTLVEAQSFGAIPVVFDSYPVAKWIVQDGKSGYLIPPFAVEAMANQIIELARYSDRLRLAEQVLESARRFHIDHVGEIWQALFETEVPKHTAPSSKESFA